MIEQSKLGKYQIVRELGRGGFGIVYEAEDPDLERHVALKILHSQLVVDPLFLNRFKQEAKLSAQLEHPNLVPVYEFGQNKGYNYLAMGFMKGGSLKDHIEKNGVLDSQQAKKIFEQILEGVCYIHHNNVVHRDLKPSNILFDQHGIARISDLGFAKAVRSDVSSSMSTSGGMIGTAAYMAPEIWNGKKATEQSDIYSLGCIAYEMLTGKILFFGETPAEAMKKHLIDGPDIKVDLSDAWRNLIEKCLAKDISERYPTARALLEDLKFGLFDPLQESKDQIDLDTDGEQLGEITTFSPKLPIEQMVGHQHEELKSKNMDACGKADENDNVKSPVYEGSSTIDEFQTDKEEQFRKRKNNLTWLIISLILLFLFTGTIFGLKKINENKSLLGDVQILTHESRNTATKTRTQLSSIPSLPTPKPTDEPVSTKVYTNITKNNPTTISTSTRSSIAMAANCNNAGGYDICFLKWESQGNQWVLTFETSTEIEISQLLLRINNSEYTCSSLNDQNRFTCLGSTQQMNKPMTLEVLDRISRKSLGEMELVFYRFVPTSVPNPTITPVEPTNPPVVPTDLSVEPTNPPNVPTDIPVEPTNPPVVPTDIPVEPTNPPVVPTDLPIEPTEPILYPIDPYPIG